jgi:predicted anti-sigma-YlaC factor YlaD
MSAWKTQGPTAAVPAEVGAARQQHLLLTAAAWALRLLLMLLEAAIWCPAAAAAAIATAAVGSAASQIRHQVRQLAAGTAAQQGLAVLQVQAQGVGHLEVLSS